ncbi:putative integral membrane protein [Actinosynnema pretiosum subsp. pretiosum]|nr:putative integral membrane protein [Actinosynnema pretiosum subsp. pretiosum]
MTVLTRYEGIMPEEVPDTGEAARPERSGGEADATPRQAGDASKGLAEPPEPPAWAVWAARVIAAGVVVPAQLVWEWLKLTARAAHAVVLRPLAALARLVGRGFGRSGRFLRERALRPLRRGLAAAFRHLVTRPARALLRLLGRARAALFRGLLSVFTRLGQGARSSGRGLRRWVLRPLGGRVLLPLARGALTVLEVGLDGLAHGVEWVCGRLYRFALRPIGHGARWGFRRSAVVLRVAGRGVARVLRGVRDVLAAGVRVLVARPLEWVWDEVVVRLARWARDGVRLLLRGLGWVARGIGRGLAEVARTAWAVVRRVVVALARLVVGSLVWAHRRVGAPLGRGLCAVGRVLVVAPARWAYREVLTPVGHALRAVGRGVRAVGRGVRAVGRGVRSVWRSVVVAPARWVRESVIVPVRLAGRRVRVQLRAAFGWKKG